LRAAQKIKKLSKSPGTVSIYSDLSLFVLLDLVFIIIVPIFITINIYRPGNPAPNFIWKKNGKKLRYTDSRYLISDFEGGSLLRIEPVRKKKEAGAYECVAENGNGDPVSASAELTVYEEKAVPAGFPQIIQNPAMKVVEKARHAVLVCEASGSPKPTITWIKDTMPIDLKANPRLSLMKQGSLRIEAAEETDQGKYECVATNTVGTEYSYSAQLYVRGRCHHYSLFLNMNHQKGIYNTEHSFSQNTF